jgi:uncharacterized phage protein (TIGR02216 family)
MSGRVERVIPWGALLAAGLKVGLTPEVFWRTSLAEWRLLVGGSGGEAMGRAELEALMRACGEMGGGDGQ